MRVWLAILALALPAAAAAAAGEDPRVSVHQVSKGVYVVSARFTVNAPAAVVRDVLTDYTAIPRIIPDVKQSRVLERRLDRVVVEQEAVSKFMFFSKRVHLVLHIEEGADRIQFRDACGGSFARYEGSWSLVPGATGVDLEYQLIAQPTFDVPLFVIRKVLTADARDMSERLRAEMLTRAAVATR